jgi:hypothetical protein
MAAPAPTPKMTTKELDACESIAKYWARYTGGVNEWVARFPEMVALFDCECEYRIGRINLCDITDTWEDCGLGRDDFQRLNGEIIRQIARLRKN